MVDFCSSCNIINLNGDSCISCGKDYCDSCIYNWFKLVTIKKSKNFNIYGDHNICINCAYLPLPPPEFNKRDQIEYNIKMKRQNVEWFNKGYIKDFENLRFFSKTDSDLITFYKLCKKLEFFNNEFFNNFKTKQFYDDLKLYIGDEISIEKIFKEFYKYGNLRFWTKYNKIDLELRIKCINLQTEILSKK